VPVNPVKKYRNVPVTIEYSVAVNMPVNPVKESTGTLRSKSCGKYAGQPGFKKVARLDPE